MTIEQLLSITLSCVGGSNMDNFSNVSNSNASSSHSTPLINVGPAAVSTLQRRTNEGTQEFNSGGPSKAAEQTRPFSIQALAPPNVVIDATESASADSTLIPASNRSTSSKSDGYQTNVIGNCSKNTTTISSTTSSTIDSPKQQKKLKHLIFSGKNLKKLVSKHKDTDSVVSQSSVASRIKDSDGISGDSTSSENISKRTAAVMAQAAMDDRHRRKFFSHHDVSSLCASLGGIAHAARAKEALERRNTTTGASAASAALRSGHSVNNDGSGGPSSNDASDVDHGDNISNELVLR